VSDGHGNAKSFRSSVGAKLAVTVTTTLLRDLVGSVRSQDGVENSSPRLEAFQNALLRQCPAEVLRDVPESRDSSTLLGQLLTALVTTRWREAASEHRRRSPFSQHELEIVSQRAGRAARAAVEADGAIAYGATLLATLVADDFIVYLQLGDGDVLAVSGDGATVRPLPKDERLFGNQTTSLCSPEAWREARVRVDSLCEATPSLILLSTDGYANSFREEKGFLEVGADLLAMIRLNGLPSVEHGLEGWLQEASMLGSGDDITVGLLCRTDGD
jgi:hypothetical protein